MSRSDNKPIFAITPSTLLKAYMCGIFPMAETADDENFHWIEPERRGIIPLDRVHVPKRLRKTIKSEKFEIRIDSDFDSVIGNCAAVAKGRKDTWINSPIRKIYREMFDLGYCHTVESWFEGKLTGGLYGISIQGAFFGESMFSIERDSSKVALVHLIGRLIEGGFTLLDTQFYSEHLSTFGAIEVLKSEFTQMLERALEADTDFHKLPIGESGNRVLKIIDEHLENTRNFTHTSAASF